MKHRSAWTLLFAIATAAGPANAQSEADGYELSVSKAAFDVPSGPGHLGENHDLYTGKLRLTQWDIELKGEGPTIRIGRELIYGDSQPSSGTSGDFGSWNLVLPMITTLASTDSEPNGRDEWIVDSKSAAMAYKRCSAFNTAASAGSYARASLWWYGVNLQRPDGSRDFVLKRVAGTRLPAPTGPIAGVSSFPLLTGSGWVIGCLATTSNSEPGEGFLAVDPEGNKYWLDHISFRDHFSFHSTDKETNSKVTRSRAMAWPSRVDDKFGNSVRYAYGAFGVTSIRGSDGRAVDVEWEPVSGSNPLHGRITAIHVLGDSGQRRTFRYQYLGADLGGVTRPDGSAWNFEADAILAKPFHASRYCSPDKDPEPSREARAAVTSPTGLRASYRFKAIRHGYSNAPDRCTDHGASTNWSLVEVSYSGPAVSFAKTFSYEFARRFKSQCAAGCEQIKRSYVNNPDGSVEVYGFNNLYEGIADGVLEWKETRAADASVLRRDVYRYRYGDSAGPYQLGETKISFGNNRNDRFNENLERYERKRVLESVVTSFGGNTYTTQINAFDTYGRQLDKSSTGPTATRRDLVVYHDDLSSWVRGQVARTTNVETGAEESTILFGPLGTAIGKKAFGQVVLDYSYDARGNIEASVDARGNVTLFDAWKRGVPQKTTYADGAVESVSVNGFGQIVALTDANGSTSRYAYDALGRMARRDFPAGDAVTWQPVVIGWQFLSTGDVGFAEPHWVRSEAQGSKRKKTHYDALMRPVREELFDSAGGTSDNRIYRRFRYDFRGSPVFESYPANTPTLAAGLWTEYDALGLVRSLSRDSELGPLITTRSHLAGGRIQETDPRGATVSTTYQLFGEPSFVRPIKIEEPGRSTEIKRDVFGNILEITRKR